MDSNRLEGKKVLIKYGEGDDTSQSDESGVLLSETDNYFIIEDEKGRIIKAPKNQDYAKVVGLGDER